MNVSNPFVAGHWIVQTDHSGVAANRSGFKPLRSGALDRTSPNCIRVLDRLIVSNPFVAGHWIVQKDHSGVAANWSGFKPLRSGTLDRTKRATGAQSVLCEVSNPFVAGHWIVPTFRQAWRLSATRRRRFKPLRSGALDRTLELVDHDVESCEVSNPFVAGHWIVRAAGGSDLRPARCIKPLSRGA
mgnify:CR=1 FL=1